MQQVQEFSQIDALDALRPEWRRLLGQTPCASFFLSLEWLEVYWRHFGAGQSLRVLTVSEGGGLSGIVPLVVRREKIRLGSVRVLTYPLHDWASFYGPIGPRPGETLAAALEHLHGQPRDWDVLELRWLGATKSDAVDSYQATKQTGWPCTLTLWDRTAMVDFAGSWPEYLAGRPRAWRRNLRLCERRLAAEADVQWVRYRPGGQESGEIDPRWDLYDACEQIAQRSWQGDATDGTTLSHASVRPFFRDAHAAAVLAGAVDMNLLLLGRRPAAFIYNYRWGGDLYGLRLGFDAAQTLAGAGTVLMTRCIADSFARGDRSFDLGVGYMDTKRHFWTRTAPIWRVSHYPLASLRAQLLRVKRWAVNRTPTLAPM